MLGHTMNSAKFYEATEQALEEFVKMEMRQAKFRQALSIIANKGIITEDNKLELVLTKDEATIIKNAMGEL